MKLLSTLFVILFVLPVLVSCGGGPQPIKFGKDACDNCRMIISDPRFGAEMVTVKGKAYKFDDINCFWKFKKSKEINDAELTFQLVIDYNKPGALIDAANACILQSDAIKSPMASKLAAFGQEKACLKNEKKWQASRHNWAATQALSE